MNCDSNFELMCLVVDGEASLEERIKVETHLLNCNQCSAEFASIQHTSKLLQTADEVAPPAYLHDAILARTVYRVSPIDRFIKILQSGLRPVPIRVMAASAAMFAIAFASYPRSAPLKSRPTPAVVFNQAISHPAIQPLPMVPAGINEKKPTILPIPVVVARNATEIFPNNSSKLSLTKLPAGVVPATKVAVNRTQVARKTAGFPKAPLGKEFGNSIVESPPVNPDAPGAATPMIVAAATPNPPMDMVAAMKDMENGMKDMGMADPAPMGGNHIILTSNTTYDNSDQVATLADLKRSLRNSNLEDQRAIEKSIKAREIRLPVFKRNF